MDKKAQELLDETDYEEEVVQKPKKNFPEQVEELVEKEDQEIEKLFEEVDVRINKIERAIKILHQWVKKNREDIKRGENNFKLLLDQK